MNLTYEKTEFLFSDNNSENDAILIGYLSTGIANTIKKLLQKQNQTLRTVTLDNVDENVFFSSPDNLDYQKTDFHWSLCENLFLLRAYRRFTPKMKRIFDKYYLKDKSVSKIAKSEGCSQSSVYHVLERCREYIIFEKMQEETKDESHNHC